MCARDMNTGTKSKVSKSFASDSNSFSEPACVTSTDPLVESTFGLTFTRIHAHDGDCGIRERRYTASQNSETCIFHSSSCAARSLTRNIGDGGCAAHRAALGATGPEELFGTRRRRDKSVALLRPRVSEDGGHRVVFGVSARLPSATRRQMKRPSVIKSNAGHGRPR